MSEKNIQKKLNLLYVAPFTNTTEALGPQRPLTSSENSITKHFSAVK